MRIEGALFAMGAVFYAFIAGVYWYFSRDVIGTTALALTGALAFLVAFYSLYTSKRVYPRPEDRLDAEVDEADSEYGFFSPNSWWPLVLGFSTMVIVFGLIFAVWLIVLGLFILFIALIGWMFEYYRGAFAH